MRNTDSDGKLHFVIYFFTENVVLLRLTKPRVSMLQSQIPLICFGLWVIKAHDIPYICLYIK